MRVTDKMRMAMARTWMNQGSRRIHDLSEQAATGKAVRRPSDDPRAFGSIVRRSDRMQRLEARQEAVERGRADLATAEGVLASAADVMVRARELATQMADGAYNAEDRAMAAAEVGQLREQLLGLANAEGARGFLFGGTATDAPPFDPAGNFVGNAGDTLVGYAEGKAMATNVSGAQAFTAAGGRDVFADLAALETALVADDVAGIQGSLPNLDTGFEQLVTARGDAGLRMDRLEAAAQIAERSILIATEHQADEEGIDLAEAVLDLTQAQGAYERSLAVTRQLLQLTQQIEPF